MKANIKTNGRNIICVSRFVGKQKELVSAHNRVDLVQGEPIVAGQFTWDSVKSGPSESDTVTCYTPITGRVIYGKLDLLSGEIDVDALVEAGLSSEEAA